MADASAIRAGRAAVEITGDTKKLQQATAQSKKYLKELSDAAAKVGDESGKGLLQRWSGWAKKEQGERRESGELALQRALRGGIGGMGADALGMGLTGMVAEVAGQAMAKATDKAVELVTLFREGKMSTGQLVGELARGLPILGDWVQVGANIREIFTGEGLEVEKLVKWTERAANATKRMYEARKAMPGAQADLASIGADEYTARILRAGAKRKAAEFDRAEAHSNNDAQGMGVADVKIQTADREIQQAKLDRQKAYERNALEIENQITRATAEAAAARNRIHGQEFAADIAGINADLKVRLSAIEEAKDAELKRLGVVGPTGAINAGQMGVYQDIAGRYGRQAAAEMSQADAKRLAAAEAEYARQQAKVYSLKQLQNEAIQDTHKREMAQLDERYKHELDLARHAGKETASIQARYDQDRKNLQTRQAQEVEDAKRSIAMQTAAEGIGLLVPGIAGRLAQTELDRAEALRREADPRTTTGVGKDAINQLYDIRRQRELMQATTSRGTFGGSAAALRGLDNRGTVERGIEDLKKLSADGNTLAQKLLDLFTRLTGG